MLEQKIFTGTNYVKLRTEVQNWIEENQGIEIIEIMEGKDQPKKPGPTFRAISIIYRSVR